MDYSSSGVDTSLDLNINYHRVCDDSSMMRDRLGMAREVQSKFIELGRKVSEKEETGALVKELNRLSEENKKLTEMLNAVSESYHALRGQMMDYMRKASREKEISVGQTKKRKSESSNNVGVNGNSESSSTDEGSSKKPREEVIKAKISRIRVRTEASDTSLVVKDGYQWRKYGQKVTRDNPCPRAYFKCSFAPSCPVKKKVQRSIEDQSILVATYEGEHNHPHTSQMEATPAGSGRNLTFGSVPCSASLGSSGPTITLDLTKSKPSNLPDVKSPKPAMDAPEVKQFLVQKLQSCLRTDPTFTAALAAAISGRMLQQNHTGKW